jgi:predicted metal-dependent phosphoesterase TrpH
LKKIDLHTHSTCSDGSLTPAELVEKAAGCGLSAVSVTDHDSTSGVAEAVAAGRDAGIEVISGVEFSLFHGDTAIHLLAYGFAPGHPVMEALVERAQKIRDDRNNAMIDRLRGLGIAIDREELEASAAGQLGRPHFAAYLVRHGKAGSIQDAFNRYLKRGGPAYVPRERFEAARAIAEIKKAGGVPVLAHPGVTTRSPAAMTGLVRSLAEHGLAGIEVIYPGHDTRTTSLLGRLAGELGLLMTGGSDFHGKSKPDIRLGGEGLMPAVPYSMFEALKESALPGARSQKPEARSQSR